MLRLADEVELVDTPEEIRWNGLARGNGTLAIAATRAMRFFRKRADLLKRELSPRRTADRVHADVQAASGAGAHPGLRRTVAACVGPPRRPWIRITWATGRRLVCRVDRRPRRLRPQGSWSADDQAAARTEFAAGRTIGGRDRFPAGEQVSAELVRYAIAQNVIKIVIGKSDELYQPVAPRKDRRGPTARASWRGRRSMDLR